MTLETRSSCSVTVTSTAAVLAEARLCDGTRAGRAAIVRTVDRERIEETIRPRLLRKLDRQSQIALVAAEQLSPQIQDVDKTRVGVFIGNDLAGWNYVHQQLEQMIESRDPGAIDPYVATAWFPAAMQGEITIAYGIRGHSTTFSAGFLSGGLALEYAARIVAAGRLDVALAGGVEAPDAPAILQALAIERRISPTHPAAEAAGLMALARETERGAATITLSRPRRCAAAALDDVAAQVDGAARIRYYPPSIDRANEPWNQIHTAVQSVVCHRFGERLDPTPPFWSGADVGSASFPLSVIQACQSAASGIPALVLGSDFYGLHLACAAVPPRAGVH